MKKKCTILIPAHNESLTIEKCIKTFKNEKNVEEVIVVANNCNDKTAKIARLAGASVIETKKIGKGNAISIGVKKIKTEITILFDGDIKNPKQNMIKNMLSKFTNNTTLVKSFFDRSKHPGPVTDILVKPILLTFNHPAKKLKQPLSGILAIKTDFLKKLKIPKDFGVDLFIILSAYDKKKKIKEIKLPKVKHSYREWDHYKKMSIQVLNVLKQFGLNYKKNENNNVK